LGFSATPSKNGLADADLFVKDDGDVAFVVNVSERCHILMRDARTAVQYDERVCTRSKIPDDFVPSLVRVVTDFLKFTWPVTSVIGGLTYGSRLESELATTRMQPFIHEKGISTFKLNHSAVCPLLEMSWRCLGG
jgi:hypothetical protein